MKILLLLILMPTLFSASIYSQTAAPLETGVSQTLAKWRASNYSDVRYKLNITLEKGAPLMKGTIEVSVKLTETGAKNDLILDWRTTQFANDKDKPFADVVAVNEKLVADAVPNGVYDYQTTKEHLLIAPKFLKTGENVIKIKFASPIKMSGAAITRYVDKEDGAEYVYSLFVPSDASTAFPLFDQPDLKARFELYIDAPKGWNAVSNSKIEFEDISLDVGTSYIDEYRKRQKYLATRTEFSFEETKPISPYVFAFAAGDFVEFAQKDSGELVDLGQIKNDILYKTEPSPILRAREYYRKTNDINSDSIFVRKSQAGKFKQHAAEVFRLNREGIKYLESYFEYKFPFPKYDLVLIPEFPFGGMEHAGATFLREDRVIFPTEPTKNDYITRANVIFHEAAHQWFGDTVTMKWFDDLWLKEGFAEFMAYKTLEKVMPEYNAWKIFYERNKQAAYLTDSTRGTTPIYQEIPNLSAAKSAYGNIVYRKAPSFLRQAEFYLGEKEFQTAVRQFLKKHEFANAEWTDLVKEFELASKQDLKDWANVWVTKRGMPIITNNFPEKTRLGDFGPPHYIYPSQFLSRDTLQEETKWKQKTVALIIQKDGTQITKELKLCNNKIYKLTKQTCENLTLENEPAFTFPNYQDYGYGIFLLDEKSRAYVLENIQTEKDDFLRSMMWGSLWDSVRFYELAPEDYVKLVIKNINVETDESTIQTLLGRVSTAMNYYLSDKQRDELAPQVEAVAFSGITSAKTAGLRITFFRAYLNLASTDNARVWLRKILESNGKPIEQELIPELLPLRERFPQRFPPLEMPSLKTKDKFDIVTKLLILEHRRRLLGKFDSEELLAELEKTKTSDEAKRYAYAAKAGIGKDANKVKYWNDFTNNKELSESYIEAAVAVWNSPRHSDLTLPYLEKALAELPNLKKNRKIFFVNGWLAAFIGGQKSAEALQIVNKFLSDNPNLDKDLRLKILENADGLERSVKIRARFGNQAEN